MGMPFCTLFDEIEKLISEEIPDREKKRALELFFPQKLEKNSFFIKEGEISTKLAFNVRGLLRTYYIDIDGNEHTKFFCNENSFFSSYTSMIYGKQSDFYIQAIEDCVLLIAEYENFKELMDSNIFWLKLRARYYEKMIMYKEQREAGFVKENATERYLKFLSQYPNLIEKVNNAYIASYLGISPVSLSRIRRNLKINKC